MADPILRPLVGPDEADRLDALHATLAVRAGAAGLVDIRYAVVDSPVGPLLLAATDEGLVRVAFAAEDHDRVLDSLARSVGPRVLRDDASLASASTQLAEYFAGTRRAFDVPLDLRLAHGFRLEVLAHLSDIPYGRTETYAQVADATGRPRAVRAVGSACATNPLPLVVPCHRVLRTGGGLGGYLGGLETKQRLLSLEAAAA